jgi:hypothetical protein
MGNAGSKSSSSANTSGSIDANDWRKHSPFPSSYEEYQVLRELKGSSKPQKVYSKSHKSILNDYYVSKCSKIPEQMVVEFSVNNAYRVAGIRVWLPATRFLFILRYLPIKFMEKEKIEG